MAKVESLLALLNEESAARDLITDLKAIAKKLSSNELEEKFALLEAEIEKLDRPNLAKRKVANLKAARQAVKEAWTRINEAVQLLSRV